MHFIIDELQICCEGHEIEELVADAEGYYHASFEFDDSWAGLAKTARFTYNDAYYDALIDTDDTCIVPKEVMQRNGALHVSVYAGTYGASLLTNTVCMRVVKTILTESMAGLPDDPDAAIYTQIVSTAMDALLKATSVEARADAGEFNGVDGEKGEPGDPGLTVTGATINSSGHLIITLSDGSTLDAGVAKETLTGAQGVEIVNGVARLPLAFYNYLEEKTYTAPSISSFSITGLGGTVEIGTSVSVSALTHKETNIAFITGNLTLKKDGTTIKSDIEPSAGSASVEFDAQTVTRNTGGNVTFTLSGVNSRGASFSASASKSFYVPKFTGTNENATVTASDILSMTRASGLQTTVTVDTTKYIYFVTNGTISVIKDADTGFGVPIEAAVLTVVTINGVDVTYNVYRTSGRISAGTYHFTIS